VSPPGRLMINVSVVTKWQSYKQPVLGCKSTCAVSGVLKGGFKCGFILPRARTWAGCG
jgi:hypothetical protein